MCKKPIKGNLFPPLYNTCSGGNAFRNPDIAADCCAFTDCDASQYGCVGVDDDVVFQNRMSGNTFDRIAVFVQRETFCP